MIRCILIASLLSYAAFKDGRAYERALHAQDMATMREINTISTQLAMLPVRGMKP